MHGDHHLVTGAWRDLMVAAGAAVGLDRLIGLDVSNFFCIVARRVTACRFANCRVTACSVTGGVSVAGGVGDHRG